MNNMTEKEKSEKEKFTYSTTTKKYTVQCTTNIQRKAAACTHF